MKKSKKRGEPFEELSVVKNAGFAKGKRRDKSINKRAGLHNKKVEEDEARVYRRKPLAVKHKRRLRKAIPAILAMLSIAMVIIISGSYAPPVNFDDLEGDYRTVYYETPNDGSSPEEHTVVETIGYLNYTLQNQPYWSSEMAQSLSAMFNIKQSTYNYKKYYNNNLISVDIAKGASTSAKQFCQTDKVVLWRDAVDVNKTNGFYTDWKTGKPSGLSINDFKKKRGLPPKEFSVYVLNENTILNAQDTGVKANGDGTYTVTADLNVNTKSGEENNICSAVYYYKQQMAVTGGLSQLPVYDYTNVTYIFDENYRVLSFEINDKYEATLRIPALGEVTSGCTSNTKTVFSYNEEDCKNSVYDEFKPYLNDFGAADDDGQEFTVSATNCLAGAFASVLTDGAVFKLDLGLGGKTVDGVVAVSLKDGGLDSLALKLGNITAHAIGEQDGYGLYLALGQNKYKFNLGGLSMPVAMSEGDGDALSGVLETLLGGDFAYDSETGLATLNSEISLFGIDIDLNFAFNVNEEKEEISLIDVKANIKYGKISLDATLKFGDESDRPADLKQADKLLYKDLLNDGVTVGVKLALGEKVVNGVAKIDLNKGEFAGVRAKLGEITVHYDGNALYIASGENKYKFGIDVFGGSVAMPMSLGGDLKSMLSGILENIVIEDGKIKVSLFGADISLDLFDGIKVSAYYDGFGGIGVEAYLSGDAAPAQLDEQAKKEYVDILDDGITVGVSLTIDGKLIKGVARIDLEDGVLVGVRAELGDATVHYVDGVLYISIAGSKIKLPVSTFGTAPVSTYGANDGGTIGDILNGLHIENGIIKIQLFGADITIDIFDGIKADVVCELFGAKINARITLSSDGAPAQLTSAEKDKYVNVTEGFSLSGMLSVTLGGEEIALSVNNLAVSFENSFSFKLDATLLLNNTYNNFYIEYLNGVLTVTYGAVSPMPIDGGEVEYNVITVRLDLLGGDLDALEQAVVNVFNRIVAVYNEVAKQNVKAANGLRDIMDTLGIARDGVSGMSEIFEKLALPTVDGKLDIGTLLKTIVLSATQDGISVTLGNIFAEIVLNNSGVSLGTNVRFGTSSFDLNISDVIICGYTDFEVPCESPLDKDGFIGLLDYLGATAEMLLQHNITLDLSGTIYDYGAAYNDYGNVKFKFNALLEYDDGGSMPLTYEDGQLYVSNDLYLHAKLDLVAQNLNEDKSLYLDVYILDGHPNGTNSGLTTGGYTPDGTGLDFYVSVSEFASGGNPLKFYGSMNEVLSIASMGVAMLNLQDIHTTSDEVNGAIASIYDLLNGMLIENYIPTVKSQFASLGESLLPNILKTDLSSLLNKIIAAYESAMNGIENKTEITEGNFIKKAAYADGRIDVVLNSATLFGVPEYEDLTFYITKTEGEHSLISGVGLENIYFGDNGVNKLNLAAGINYGKISKPDTASAFKDYKNFDGLDKLLLSAVNSATHETTEGEREAGYLADYKLNDDYCVDGDLTLKILGNEIGITINAFHINIDENNDVSFDINLSYSKEKFWGMIPLLTDSATVDLSIKNDMVYIKKAIDGGAMTYRIMPTSTFMDDMFNQLSYMLSFGDTINKLADQFMSGSSQIVYPTFDDYGDYIDKFVTLYEYSESSSEWNLTINGDTLSGLAGMSGLKDINVKFKGENGILKTLSLDGGLSIISFSGTLAYLNPNEKFVDGKSDLSTHLPGFVETNMYYSWTEVLGGDTFGEIKTHLKWNDVAGNEKGYLSYANGELTLGDYVYIGASYQTDSGYAIGSLSELKARGVSGVKFDAVWMKTTIKITAKRDWSLSWGGVKYSYTLGLNSFGFSIICKDEVARELALQTEKCFTFGYLSGSSAYEPDITGNRTADTYLTFTNENNTFTCTAGVGNFSDPGFPTSSFNYGHVAVNLVFKVGGSTLNTAVHRYEKF